MINKVKKKAPPPENAMLLKKRVLNWLQTMHDKEGPSWAYRLNSGSDITVYTSCFAVFIKHLFNDLKTLSDEQRSEWLTYLKGFQQEQTGLFVDPQASERITDPTHDEEHLNRQLTTFCLSAIEALGDKPDYPLSFLDEWKGITPLTSWLDSLDWENPWNSGNKVMFLAICLAYNYEHFEDDKAREALDVWFDWMDRHQNPGTGFWGTSRDSNYFIGMGGFYHQFLIYEYFDREVQYAERVVDRILFLQQPDGLYFPGQGGGSCDDIDATASLVHLYHKYDYRRDDIRASLKRSLSALLENQNSDGGFCWSNRRKLKLSEYWKLITSIFRSGDPYYWYIINRRGIRSHSKKILRHHSTIKTGWNRSQRTLWDSSLFDTWMRCLTIAEICTVLTEEPYASLDWQFLTTPGLGWFIKI